MFALWRNKTDINRVKYNFPKNGLALEMVPLDWMNQSINWNSFELLFHAKLFAWY